jgi:ankyrin repeat protein
MSAMHTAAARDHAAILSELLKFGGNVNLRSALGLDALQTASVSGSSSVVRVLIDAGGVALETVDRLGRTPLLCAASCGSYEACVLLLKVGGGPSFLRPV